MKRCLFLCSLILFITLCPALLPAGAEDCFVINIDLLDMTSLRSDDYVAAHLTAQASGIRVQKYISDSNELAARVRLTILQVETNTLIFDKNYGYQSKTFDSGDIYLPYVESRIAPYLVTLYIEDWVYAIPFMHLTPRLSYNGACVFGVRMRDYDASLTSNWLMGSMLDLNDLRARGQLTLPICASNAFIVGEATIALLGNDLTVSLRFFTEANVELHQIAVYCVAQVAGLTSAEPPLMLQRAYQPGEGIDVSNQASVLLYVPMSISYDSTGLAGFAYDLSGNAELQRQLALWNENLYQTFTESLVAFPSVAPDPTANTPPPKEHPTVFVEPPSTAIPTEILTDIPTILPEDAPMGITPEGVQELLPEGFPMD